MTIDESILGYKKVVGPMLDTEQYKDAMSSRKIFK